jgi:hypothetical protein
MKKFILISLCGLLIIAFTTTAYAVEVKFSGQIYTITEYWRNVSAGDGGAGIYNGVDPSVMPGGGNFNKTAAYLESRARMKFDFVADPNLSGTIFFEMDAQPWGGSSASSRNNMGYWAMDRAAVEIKNVYMDFGLPYFGIPVPITMRVGGQPLAIRPNLMVYTDGMGITAGIKADPVMIQPMWFKPLEGQVARADDADVYGLQVSAKVDTFTLGGYVLYYDMLSYPFNSVYDTANNGYEGIGPESSFKAKMWWIGLYADGKAGPVNLNFDFIYDTGKVKNKQYTDFDTKYNGWVTRLQVDYPWELFHFGLVGLYASGADTQKTLADGKPSADPSATSTKVKSWVDPPGSEAFAAFGESLVFYSSACCNNGNTGISETGSYTALSNGGFGGTWMAKLYGSYQATPWYKVTLQALYIGDTTKHGNTVGTARESDGVTLRDDKTIGFEFDLINYFQIYKNLYYEIGGGFMTRGKGLEYWDPVAGSNVKPKTPWIIASMLNYSF